MSDILSKIIQTKQREVAQKKQSVPFTKIRSQSEIMPAPLGFAAKLTQAAAQKVPGVIAEVKKASSSKGVIREHFEPVSIASSYAQSGACCLSVLTDEKYFLGSDDYLIDIRETVDLPILRKDFMIDEYQIYESRALGADCILLIVAALDHKRLCALYQVATDLGMDVLIEVHDRQELDVAIDLSPQIIGINNRNLRTFKTSLDTTIDLLPHIPAHTTVVTESGLSTRADIQRMQANHVYCFLVGEAFMRAEFPGEALADLFFNSGANQ